MDCSVFQIFSGTGCPSEIARHSASQAKSTCEVSKPNCDPAAGKGGSVVAEKVDLRKRKENTGKRGVCPKEHEKQTECLKY